MILLTLAASSSTGASITADYNFVSQDPTLATVSSAGEVCAGVWNADGTVCTPAANTGQTIIQVTPQKGSATATVTVFVHEKIDYIVANPPSSCVSSTQVANVSATAYSQDVTYCASLSTTPPCAIPQATLGPFSWGSVNSSVVRFNNTINNYGVATASVPGETQIFASLGNLNSPAVNFTTCPIVKLVLCTSTPCTTPPSSNTFSLAAAGTEALYAEAIDSNGTVLVSPPIIWTSTNTYALTLGETAATSTTPLTTLAFTATGAHAGSYATILAACVRPGCNINLSPIYSNSLVGQVTGTPNATIYAASTQSTTVVPISYSNNSLGTSVTLGHVPSSLLINPEGNQLVFGADSGGVMLLAAGGTTPTTTSINGRPLAFSPDGSTVLLSNPVEKVVYALNITSISAAIVFNAPNGATGGGFTPDSATLWFTDGSTTLYTYNMDQGLLKYTLAAPAVDAAFIGNGPIGYVAEPAPTTVVALATCDPTQTVDTQLLSYSPTKLAQIPSGNGVAVLDLPEVRLITNPVVTQNVTATGCTVTAAETASSAALPNGGSLNVTSFFVTPDSSKAIVISKTGGVVDVVTISNGTVTPITLTGSPASIYPGGVLADGSMLYVGASDGTVHAISLSTNTDTTQINPQLTDTNGNATYPDLVGVAPQ